MDSSFWMKILAQLLEGLVPVAIIVIGIAIRQVLVKNNASKEQIALVDGAYEILARAARTTNQIWVEAIKLANGSLTEEQAAKARRDTTEVFKQMITEATKYAIEAAYGSIENYVNIYLESAVNSVKDIYVPISEEKE